MIVANWDIYKVDMKIKSLKRWVKLDSEPSDICKLERLIRERKATLQHGKKHNTVDGEPVQIIFFNGRTKVDVTSLRNEQTYQLHTDEIGEEIQ